MLPFNLGSGGGMASYQISNSLRFNGTSSYLTRTFGTPTTQNTFTLSLWVKRSKLSVLQNLFGVSTNNSIGFTSTDALVVTLAGSATITTTALYRDPAAWYHIVYTQTTGAAYLYVNGAQVGTSATVSAVFNTAVAHQLFASNTTNYTDGYGAETVFVDGQVVSVGSFGATDATTGQWKPKAYTGTYGNNGFHLDFKNGASTTTLGYDVSGNANNWTLNNMVRAAGATDCWVTDTPTNNYATLNPAQPSGGYVISNGALTSTCHGTDALIPQSSICPSAGKWWSEVTVTSMGAGTCWIGIIPTGTTANIQVWYLSSGSKVVSGSTTAYGATYAATDVIGMALDVDGGTATFYKQTGGSGAFTSQGVITLPTMVGGWSLSLSVGSSVTMVYDLNCGQRVLSIASQGGVPTGFKALCTTNLTSDTVTVSGTFTGNLNADGPCVWCNGWPLTLTINSNAVTFGTHADKIANGFKLRTASASYNASGSNTWTATITSNNANSFRHANAQGNP